MMTSTKVIFNASIYTRHFPAPTSMLIENGVITWLGSDSASESFTTCPRIDAQGLWIAPAFVDAHVHLTNTGLISTGIDLTFASSIDEMHAQLSRHQTEDVCIAHGWDDSRWSMKVHESKVPKNLGAIYASRIDVHSAFVSPKFLELCPEVRRADGFHESGVVSADAHHLARRFALSRLSDEQINLAQKTALKYAASQGICAVHEMSGPEISGVRDALNIQNFKSMEYPEVILWWGEINGQKTASEIRAHGCGGDLFVDGSIGSRTAHLCDPYVDGGIGRQYQKLDELVVHIESCIQHGLATGFHAIGDAALGNVLQAYVQVFKNIGDVAFRSVPHQIEHAEMLSLDNIATMAHLGITASMQPVFDELWAGDAGMYDDRLGARWKSMNNFAQLSKQGVLIAFGSDSPVTPLDPWRAIQAAETPHIPEHGISRRAAFAAHTRSSWRALRMNDIGEIEIGMKASLAFWEVDGFEVSTPDHVVRNWSTDPRSATPPLPVLADQKPICIATLREGHTIFTNGKLGL